MQNINEWTKEKVCFDSEQQTRLASEKALQGNVEQKWVKKIVSKVLQKSKNEKNK